MTEKFDARYIKEKLIKYMIEKGPSLPVNLAKHVGLNSLFTSAFLSELASEGIIKISSMKVGGSPLYFTPDKFAMLENFFSYLGIREREASNLLKEKGMLQDNQQTPIVRVALRGLKDFALPFKKNEKLFWRYFLVSEEEVRKKLEQEIIPVETVPLKVIPGVKTEEPKIEKPMPTENLEIVKIQEKEIEKINLELEEKRKELEKIKEEILNLSKPKKEPKKSEKTIKALKKKAPIKEEKFLKEIEASLEKKKIKLLNVESYDRKQVFARIRVSDKEYLLAAYDKKKIGISDILKAHKKALAFDIPYYIISKGDASRKTREAIEAYKNLAAIDLLEQKEEKTQVQEQ